MTFSIVARDPLTGDLGVAVASKFLAVGSVVSHARAGVGAVATQALANYTYGANGLDLMSSGMPAPQAVRQVTNDDEGRAHRQLGMVDALANAATYTGASCMPWAGGRTAEGVAAQGNLLAGANVVDALIETYLAGGLPFPELLIKALNAADAEGGDRRGRQSAALLIVRDGGGYGGNNDRWIDLRVDDDPSPIDGLAHLMSLNHLYAARPAVEDLIAIDDALATQLQEMLERVGYSPTQASGVKGSLSELIDGMGLVRTGEPRDVPERWNASWESAMAEWMSVENLEERMTARGLVDPRVLEHLSQKSAS
jgi:uncharacterized Ntn-hydrolase superfamily protein